MTRRIALATGLTLAATCASRTDGQVTAHAVRAALPALGSLATSTMPPPTASTSRSPAPSEHPWQVANASWYGPGFNGHGTACGQRYGPDLYGVAHRQLPCGTLLDFEWMGTVFRDVPVVDRGPYVRGRTWDLTQEACEVMQYETGVGRCHTGAIAWRLAT